MNKQELSSMMQNIMNNYVFGMTLLNLAIESDFSNVQYKKLYFFGENLDANIDLKYLFKDVNCLQTQRPLLIDGFSTSLKRAVVAEIFEAIKYYSNETKQFEVFKNCSYYNLLRILRNSTSHGRGGHISWPPEFKKKGINKVEWYNINITEEREGEELVLFDSDMVHFLQFVINETEALFE